MARFFVITHELSNKMRHIAKNPQVAISGEWFTAVGLGVDLGYIGRPENAALSEKLRQAFVEWIDNGHVDFSDKNTCILQIQLKTGILFANGTRHDIVFGE